MSALPDPITHPLTAIRIRRGWSQQRVAAIIARRSGVNMSTQINKVSRWETGRSTPQTVAQHALADELGVPREVVTANPWPEWLTTVDRTVDIDADWSVKVAGEVLDIVVQSALMDRRTFIGATASGLVSLARGWSNAGASVATGGGRGTVTHQAVEHLQRRVEELWRLDDALGGGGCLQTGVADLQLVTALIRGRRYDAEVGQRLHGIAGALGRFCGWAAFDSGRVAAAADFWQAGLRSAAVAGDTSQGVYALSNLALATVYGGDGRTALNLLDLARTKVDPAQRVVHAMLDCWASRAHALIGDGPAAVAAVQHADALWERRVPGDDPDWTYWMPRPSLTAEASTALMHAGDYANAEAHLTAGLNGAADAGPRDRTLYLARLAETRLLAGRQDEAVATVHDAVELGAGVDSARVRARVDGVIALIPAQGRARAELVEHRAAAWAA